MIKYHNQFLINQEWARQCGQWLENVYYPEIEGAGLYLRRDDDGNVVTSPGKIRSVAANVQGNSGVPFIALRRKQTIKAGSLHLEQTVLAHLLRRDDGSVGGVFALNHICGEYVIVLARAVILATDYSDRLHKRLSAREATLRLSALPRFLATSQSTIADAPNAAASTPLHMTSKLRSR